MKTSIGWTNIIRSAPQGAALLSAQAAPQISIPEFHLGPVTLERTVQGVPLSLRSSAFLSLRVEADRLLIDARLIADLSDLQLKIGSLVDTVPLPTDNCSHFGIDNLVARIWGKQLTVDGEVATLKLNGDVEIWTCAKNPIPCSRVEWDGIIPRPVFYDCNPPLKNRNLTQPFEARLPIRLGLPDSRTLGIQIGNPEVDLGGALGDLTERFLQIFGVDVNRRVKEALDQAISPELLRLPLPEDLVALEPTITRAELRSESGALTAYAEMTFAVGGKTLAVLMQMILALLKGGALES